LAAKGVNVGASNSPLKVWDSGEMFEENYVYDFPENGEFPDSGFSQETMSDAFEDSSKIEQLSDVDTDECIDLENYQELRDNYDNKQKKQQAKEQRMQNKSKRIKWWDSIKEDVAEAYLSWKQKTHGERWSTYTLDIDREYLYCSCTSGCVSQTKKTEAFHNTGKLIILMYRGLM
jgi:hypothetical protein